MKKLLFILFICTIAKYGYCQTADEFTKGLDGMEYAIVNSGKGDLIKAGDILELHFTSLLSRKGKQDSILNNTREMGMAQFIPFDSMNIPPAYFIIFIQMKVGDSVSSRTIIDSMFKENPEQVPPFMKKGDLIYTNMRIIYAYKTQAAADSARTIAMENAEKIAKEKADVLVILDDKKIADYVANNNVKAVKTKKGVYVEIIAKGKGAFLNTKSIVKIKYKGKTLEGVIFDTNMDKSKGHTDPLIVNLTKDKTIGNAVIPGLENGLYKLQKGSKAKIYIPSGLAYGPRGGGADLPPNANLVFEIEVIDIISKAQMIAENKAMLIKENNKKAAQERLMKREQKKYMDNLKKTDPKKYEEVKQQMQQQTQQQMQQR